MKFYTCLFVFLLITLWINGIGQNSKYAIKASTIDSLFNVTIHTDSFKCIVTVENPSPHYNYVFEWYDMPLEVLLKREAQKHKFIDTLNNLNSEHNYEVRVYKTTAFDTNEVIKKFSSNHDLGWKYACIYYVEEPEIFTPNGDGYNETWGIKVANNSYYSLTVYTRFGEKVFVALSDACVWNGINQQDNSPCPVGGYYFVLEYNLIGQEDKPNLVKKGIVNLLRNVK